MKRLINVVAGWLTAAMLLAGCATAPPADRVSAESPYQPGESVFSSSAASGTLPVILVRQPPTLLLKIDGPPRFRSAGSGVEKVVNASPALFYTHADNRYYLAAGARWLSAGHLNGPWVLPETLPAGLPLLVSSTQSPVMYYGGKPVNVILANPSAHLVLVDGKPLLKPIGGADLKVVANASQPIYFDRQTQFYYVRAANRWFRARRLENSWTPTDHDLPPAVARYSAYTPPAAFAAKGASGNGIKAARPNSRYSLRQVQYNGTPDFRPIPGTRVAYATNADAEIFVIGEQFYRRENGSWFAGASAGGPWQTVSSVPDDLYQAPPLAAEQEVERFSTDTARTPARYEGPRFGLTHIGIGVGSCGRSGVSLGFGSYPWGYAYPSFMFGYSGWGRHWGRRGHRCHRR